RRSRENVLVRSSSSDPIAVRLLVRNGDIAQEMRELPQPRGGEVAQLTAVALLQRLGDFIEKAQASGGDPDEHRTAVGVRAVPLDEVVGLEFVDHARDV